MLWVGTAAVLRVQSCASESSAGPAASGEKGTEDVLPSWRSLRSLGVQGTALVLGSGSLAANGEISATILFPRNVGVKENRKTFCAKGPAHNLITRLPEMWNQAVSGQAALVGNGGREGIRTPGLLIANSGENKLRQGATIT